MKNLKFHYHMQITFDSPVHDHRFTIKCIPQSTDCQTITELQVDIYPNRFLSKYKDSFGNISIYGYSELEHDTFFIDVQGNAKTGLSDFEQGKDFVKVGYYKYQTEYTRPGLELRKYHNRFTFTDDMDNLNKSRIFMHQLYEDFKYVQGVTNFNTTAEEALIIGQGVCQDYAHIMLSLCRMEQIPCRYVVGMLMGEGQSHAWVEIYQEGRWYALDPTNNLEITTDHIKISNGRDYTDCTINQGLFVGNAAQHQEITVRVEEINKGEESYV